MVFVQRRERSAAAHGFLRIAVYVALGSAAFLAGLVTRPARGSRASSGDATVDREKRSTPGATSSSTSPGARTMRTLAMPRAPRSSTPEATGIDDPIALSNLGLPAREIFEGQPRDPVWAPAAERFLAERLAEYLAGMIPYATDTSIECRASVCKVAFQGPNDKLDEAFSLIQSFPLGDVRLAPSMDRDTGTVTMTILYRPEVRPVEEMPRHYAEQMARRFPEGFAQARAWVDEHGANGDKTPEKGP